MRADEEVVQARSLYTDKKVIHNRRGDYTDKEVKQASRVPRDYRPSASWRPN